MTFEVENINLVVLFSLSMCSLHSVNKNTLHDKYPNFHPVAEYQVLLKFGYFFMIMCKQQNYS